MDSIQNEKEFLKLLALRKSNNFNTIEVIRNIRAAYSIFYINYLAYSKVCNLFYKMEISNMISNDCARWRKQRLIVCNVHNLLASGISFIDCVEKFWISDILKNKKQRLFYNDDGFYHFIREFRNFLIHRQPLPLISKYKCIENGKKVNKKYQAINIKEIHCYLNTKRDSEYLNFAKYYLSQQGKEINLDKILEKFYNLTKEFYNWLLLRYIYDNRKSLRELISQIENITGNNNQDISLPIPESQKRHLKWLLKKADIQFEKIKS